MVEPTRVMVGEIKDTKLTDDKSAALIGVETAAGPLAIGVDGETAPQLVLEAVAALSKLKPDVGKAKGPALAMRTGWVEFAKVTGTRDQVVTFAVSGGASLRFLIGPRIAAMLLEGLLVNGPIVAVQRSKPDNVN